MNLITITNRFGRALLFQSLLLLGCFSALAQTADVIPPSPTAAGLGKYGEIPVDKSTGIPNIQIPLYTIKQDDIEVPISLSFHSSGNKPRENAGWVGLGWSLNAGGVVTRYVKGDPDENGYFFNMNRILQWEDDNKLWLLSSTVPIGHPDGANLTAIKEDMHSIILRGKDIEPDLFLYNFPGGSGKFMFNADMSITKFPYDDIQITPINLNPSNSVTPDPESRGILDGFDIHTSNGLEYRFNETESVRTTFPLTTPVEVIEHFSGWYLTRINSKVSNAIVSFGYSEEEIHVEDPVYSRTFSSSFVSDLPWEGQTFGSTTSQSQTTTFTKYLEFIDWDGGLIEFYKSARTDLTGAMKLDSVLVKDKSENVIKKFVMTYDYFGPNRPLRLLSVRESTSDGDLPPHEFEYYQGVPEKGTFAIDHYGYYNGKTDNSHLVPYRAKKFGVKEPLADRSIGLNQEAKVGLIKTIKYPTGGYSTFEFEPNNYFGQTTTSVSSSFFVANCDSDGALHVDPVTGNTYVGLVCDSLASINVDIPANVVLDVDRGARLMVQAGFTQGTQINAGDLTVQIFEDNNGLTHKETFQLFTNNPQNHELNFIEPGKSYVVQAEAKIDNTSIDVTFEYSKVEQTNITTGGMRVSKIENYDKIDAITPSRELLYEYVKPSAPTESSGYVSERDLIYHYDQDESVVRNANNGLLVSTFIGTTLVSVESAIGLSGRFYGPTVTYSHVTQRSPGNGSTLDEFEVSAGTYELFPIGTPIKFKENSNYWKRGKLLSSKVYDESGTLLSENRSHYGFHPKDTSRWFIYENDFVGTSGDFKIRYEFNEQSSGWARIDSTTTTTYENGTPITSTTGYEYLEDSHLMPVGTNHSLGSGLSYSDTTVYLNDVANHVLSPVLIRETYKENNQLKEKVVNTYTDFKLTNSQIFMNQDVTPQLTSDFTYVDGLKVGNVTRSDGTSMTYVWGYDGQYPVASISPAVTMSQTLIDAVLNHSFTGDETVDLSFLQSQLSAYINDPNQMVNLYTYKPLVGMTSQTDPNGVTTYYKYDSHNRLEAILDQDQNFLKKYSYIFKNQ